MDIDEFETLKSIVKLKKLFNQVLLNRGYSVILFSRILCPNGNIINIVLNETGSSIGAQWEILCIYVHFTFQSVKQCSDS